MVDSSKVLYERPIARYFKNTITYGMAEDLVDRTPLLGTSFIARVTFAGMARFHAVTTISTIILWIASQDEIRSVVECDTGCIMEGITKFPALL